MGGDVTRISYDSQRHYVGLKAQQGRVTVDADWNEAATIDAVRDREATLDIVGRFGTPDRGYAVTATPASGSPISQDGLSVGAGTLYLGGERFTLDVPIDLAAQPDWLDTLTGTLWVAPPPQPSSPLSSPTAELVYLLAIEQEVSAVEDPALADVALGGPDTTQRLRFLQRFVRVPTQAQDCTKSWAALQDAWAGIGLAIDPTSMRLTSSATLLVGFETDPAPPSPCQPVAAGGYLGAENQLIRVQITDVDANDVPTIVWGFDNATYLYELTSAVPDGNGQLILKLAKPPVDSYHNPVLGQAVELLRDAASLTLDDPPSSAGQYISAATGIVSTLTQGYDSSSATVAIAGDDLPTDYDDANQLYLRVWQAITPAPAGTTVELTGAGANTGVTVTLNSSTQRFHPGDYWCFAVRPSVPDLIYPARYGLSPQPPEGPRVLACPVAMVVWTAAGGPQQVSSCIPPFDNLVDLTARGGQKQPEFLVVKDVTTMSGNTIVNNMPADPAELAKGIMVTFSEPLGIELRGHESILRITIDLPYPAEPDSQGLWRQYMTDPNNAASAPTLPLFLGTVPLSLPGNLRVSGPKLAWLPTPSSATFLSSARFHKFGVRAAQAPYDQIRAELTIRGDAVWSAAENPRRYLNGEVLLTNVNQDLLFSITSNQYDPQLAADYRMWFFFRVPQ